MSTIKIIQNRLIQNNKSYIPRPQQISNNIQKNDVYKIKTRESNTSIRLGEYNAFTGKFGEDFPVVSSYFLPKQKISFIYNDGRNFLKFRNSRLNSINKPFLSANYLDAFNDKDVVLLADSPEASLNMRFDKPIYVIDCNNNQGNCQNLYAWFIQPTYDVNSEAYQTSGNLGLSFNSELIVTEFNNVYAILDIVLQSEIIIHIMYDTIYADTNIILKHPLIDNYLSVTLLDSDQTITLEH